MRWRSLRRVLAVASLAPCLLGGHAVVAADLADQMARGVGTSALPLAVDPARQVYAFDDPPILVRQIVFGLAHGVTLLARACFDVAEELRRPTQVAYEEWLMRYGERIIDSEQGLSRYYFGARAAEAGEDDIARALNLPAQLDPLPPEQLRAACASFPEALSRPRYNLDRVFAGQRDEQRLARAGELRAAVAQCRQLAAAPIRPAIDAAFAAWEAANGEVEAAARAGWLEFRGDERELRRWQESIAAGVQRRLAADPTGSDRVCRQLIADLPAARNRLSTLIDEPPSAVPTPSEISAPRSSSAAPAEAVIGSVAERQGAPTTWIA